MGVQIKTKKKAGDDLLSSSEFHPLNSHNMNMAEPLNSPPTSSSAGLSSATASSSANEIVLYDEHVHRRRPLHAPLKAPASPRSTFISSMFGRQVLSQRATGPTICFGTANQATKEKQYYSQEMDKARAGLDGPGPIYEVKVTSIGKQVASQKESFPEVGFALSRRFSPQRYGYGNPGPGAYSSTSAFGPQILSYQKSPSSADFSRSTRDEQNKIYMSAEFDKNKYGVGSPGPTVCDDSSSMGNQIAAPFKSAPRVRFGAEKRFKGETQVDSRKASSTASRFGRATRFKDYYSDIPGPGNYNC